LRGIRRREQNKRADHLRKTFKSQEKTENVNFVKEKSPIKDMGDIDILKKLLENSGSTKKEDSKTKLNVSSKRNSQKPVDSKPKLDEKSHGKRPSSDDEMKKGKIQKSDQNKGKTIPFKVSLRSISKRSQDNQ
jgi:hypothetical protein